MNSPIRFMLLAAAVAASGAAFAGGPSFTSQPESTFPAEVANLYGFAAADTDNDGDDEIFLAAEIISGNSSTPSLAMLENTNGTQGGLQFRVLGPGSVAVPRFADTDGDGLAEVLIGNRIYRNLGGNDFEPVALPLSGIDVIPWDLDQDGDLDFLAASGHLAENVEGFANPFALRLIVLAGSGMLTEPFAKAGSGTGIAQWDGFNLTFSYPSATPFVFRGSTVGSRADTGGSASYPPPVAADFDGDGDTDVATATGSIVRVFLNGGAAPTFEERVLSTFTTAWGIDSGDFDGNGVADVLASTVDGKIAFYEGTAFGLERVVNVGDPYVAQWITSADINGDGRDDVFTARRDGLITITSSFRTWTNGGTFATPTPTPTPSPTPEPEPICPDLNGDGNVDVADLLGVLLATF